MLYEFALTPDVFDGDSLTSQPVLGRDLVTVLRELRDNGLVSDLHKGKWSQQILPRIETLPSNLREAVTKHLGVLRGRNRIVRRPVTQESIPRTDTQWLAEAIRSHCQLPFHAVVTTQPADDAPEAIPLLPLDGVTETEQWTNRRRSVTVRRTLADYETVLGPILRYARAIYLIDPYLTCSNPRFFSVVELCARLTGLRVSVPTSADIEIHCKCADDGEPSESVLREWEERLRRLRSQLHYGQRHRFRVFVWRQRLGGENLHDRCLLTDQCGLSLPGGFDVAPRGLPPGTTTWTMFDWEDIDANLRRFQSGSSPYDLVGQREVTD